MNYSFYYFFISSNRDKQRLKFKREKPLRFPKLKKLTIDFKITYSYLLAYIDFSSCSETLETLVLRHFGDYQPECFRRYYNVIYARNYQYFMKTIRMLRVIKTLTIKRLIQYMIFINEISHLSSLRLVS